VYPNDSVEQKQESSNCKSNDIADVKWIVSHLIRATTARRRWGTRDFLFVRPWEPETLFPGYTYCDFALVRAGVGQKRGSAIDPAFPFLLRCKFN
jgi:hypothetical protein